MTPDETQRAQDALNALMGDPAWKHKIVILPPSGPPPSVALSCGGSSYGDVGVLLECPCGWQREICAGEATFEINLLELRDLSRHTCEEPDDTDGLASFAG